MGNTPSTPKNPSTIWLGGSRPTRSAQRSRSNSQSKSRSTSRSRSRSRNGGREQCFKFLGEKICKNPN